MRALQGIEIMGLLRIRRAWGAAFAAATLLTLLMPTQHHLAERMRGMVAVSLGSPAPPRTPWTKLFLNELPVWYVWLLLCIVVFWLCRRLPLTGPHRLRNAALHLPAGAAVVVAHIALVSAIRMPYASLPPQLGYLDVVMLGLSAQMVYFMTIYAGTVGIYHAAVYYTAYRSRELHAAQLETALTQAQLDVLKMQLDPHFLFNTLNSISSLMFRDVRAAQGMIARLGDLLRLSLENSASHEVPLREELGFLEQYVEIQKIRFQDRLTVAYRIDPAALEVLVPRLVLQPLVENAIRHGIGERASPGEVIVSAEMRGGRLLLQVSDDGPGLREGAGARRLPTQGIGLRNTRERLQQLYGDDGSFELANLEPSGLAVRLELPARALREPSPV